MHPISTVKSIVLTGAFATQCVHAKSRNGYAYFDEKFCVLEWIIYLKRLSLIALILCGVVLYYVPKSRSYARRVCCILIDTIANGLKFALNANETEEKIKTRDDDQNKELKIQELYRKVYEESTRDYGQKYSNKTSFDNNNHKLIRKHKSRKHGIKHKDGKRHRHNRYRNTVNNISPEPDAAMASTIPQPITMIDEQWKKDSIVIPQNTSSEMRIATYAISVNKLKDNTDLQQENSWNTKTNSTVSEIIDKNDRNCKTASQEQEDVRDISTDIKLLNKQNLNYMKREEIKIVSQLSKNCATRIVNKQMDPCYEKLFVKQDLCEFRRKNDRLSRDIKSFTHECYENSSITKDRVKPVLLRVINWLFGGCPKASRRYREQTDEVGKEEIFEPTNTWLAKTSGLYLQRLQ